MINIYMPIYDKMLSTGKKEADLNKKSNKEDTTSSIAESISKASLEGSK